MIKGLCIASVWSADLNNLLPFYRDVIGLEVSLEAPGFVVLGNPRGPAVALGTHSDVHGKNADAARHMVGLETDDIEGEFQRLKARGVEFIEEPTKFDAVTVATFKDPEENLVQLLQFN